MREKTVLPALRDYAVEQPSYTCAFAAWELGVSPSAVNIANAQLLKQGIVREIEPRCGPYAAVYQYVSEIPETRANVRRIFAELDDARDPRPAVVVPHTRIRGSSGKPGKDRRRQEQGVRLKRGSGKGPKRAA